MKPALHVALVLAALLFGALHLHSPWASPASRVTIYREIVCYYWFDAMPLAMRYPVLDRMSPLRE